MALKTMGRYYERMRDQVDWSGREEAEKLASHIEAYWAGQGKHIKTWVELEGTDEKNVSVWGVRSKWLKDAPKPKTRVDTSELGVVTLVQIRSAVCEALGISSDDIKSKRRLGRFVLARQIYYYIAEQRTYATPREMGMKVGVEHWSTVTHGITKIRELVKLGDQKTLKYIEQIERLL